MIDDSIKHPQVHVAICFAKNKGRALQSDLLDYKTRITPFFLSSLFGNINSNVLLPIIYLLIPIN